jgi:hypothetical protein
MTWDEMPDVNRRIVIDALVALKKRETARDWGLAAGVVENIRAIVDAAIEKLGAQA